MADYTGGDIEADHLVVLVHGVSFLSYAGIVQSTALRGPPDCI